jgi:hypothetical protein
LLARVALLGAAAVYGVSNSIFNVEGGHRAIVFNRVVGIKEEVGIGLDLELERALTLTRATRFARSPGVRGGDAFYAAVVRKAYYFRRPRAAERHPDDVRVARPADGEHRASSADASDAVQAARHVSDAGYGLRGAGVAEHYSGDAEERDCPIQRVAAVDDARGGESGYPAYPDGAVGIDSTLNSTDVRPLIARPDSLTRATRFARSPVRSTSTSSSTMCRSPI